MRAITADYHERIVIAPEDVIPKSTWFKFVKYSLLTALILLILFAIIALIVAESFAKTRDRDSLALGVVSLVGVVLFLLGIVAIMKEHIPLVLTFSVSMIIYLLIFMYSRVITSSALIFLRTAILLLLALEAFFFCVMIRDWRAIQVSRLNQRLMKLQQQQQQQQQQRLLAMQYGHHFDGIAQSNLRNSSPYLGGGPGIPGAGIYGTRAPNNYGPNISMYPQQPGRTAINNQPQMIQQSRSPQQNPLSSPTRYDDVRYQVGSNRQIIVSPPSPSPLQQRQQQLQQQQQQQQQQQLHRVGSAQRQILKNPQISIESNDPNYSYDYDYDYDYDDADDDDADNPYARIVDTRSSPYGVNRSVAPPSFRTESGMIIGGVNNRTPSRGAAAGAGAGAGARAGAGAGLGSGRGVQFQSNSRFYVAAPGAGAGASAAAAAAGHQRY